MRPREDGSILAITTGFDIAGVQKEKCMGKKLTVLTALALCLTMALPLAAGGSKDAAKKGSSGTVLTMGSWRADDVAGWTALLAEYKKATGVEIQFKPTNPPDYNATLRLQLESGTGPDLMFARSYDTGIDLFKNGYFADVSAIKGLKENFSEGNRAPWTTADGKAFAIPLFAVIQSVYYNKDIFAANGISVPKTWEEFLAACDKLKKAGITPIANGLADEWDINECFMMGILPNFVGGYKGRLEYETGKRAFNDANMVKAFQAMADLAKYCPDGYEAIGYNDSNALFATGKAAMYADGSWSLDTFKDMGANWGNFAFPAPAGAKAAICFHADAGLTMNAATKHPAEAKAFLEWLCTPEGATVAARYLPNGFYPMISANIKIEDAHSAELYGLIQGKDQDVRFCWPKLMSGDPSGYVLMNQGVIKAMKGQITARQAADDFAAGLAKWYKPN